MSHARKVVLIALSLCFFVGIVFEGTETLSQELNSIPANIQNRYSIASYNLGSSDLTDPDVIRMTADLISRFDVVALQCLRGDNAETNMLSLVNELNRNNHQYEYLLGPSVWNISNRYAFIYRSGIMYPVAWYLFDDSPEDAFVCEPFIARFETADSVFDLTIIAYFTETESRSQEIDGLPAVVDDVKVRFPDESDIIILCSAVGSYDTTSSTDPFKPLEQDGYVLLLGSETTQGGNLHKTVEPQIVIAASSEEMYWEDAGTLTIDSLLSAEINSETALLAERAGYSSIIIVNSEPDDPKYDEDDTKTKAGCFFSTVSN